MRSPLKIGVVGASGRMGFEVTKLLASTPGVRPYLSVGKPVPGYELTATDFADFRLSGVDAWIDFSSGAGLAALLPAAIAHRQPVVSGSTGHIDHAALETAGEKIPVLWASNMSLGVAVLNEAIRLYGKLAGFDFQIEEIHHRHKKDAPSGTALSLQQTLQSVVTEPLPAPLAIRGGGVYGIHKVWAMAEEETLAFEHQALNRAVFAKGAVRAALWLHGRTAKLYSIADVLN